MMFSKFWTQSDVDWSVKLDDSGSYDVRSEMEWLFSTQSDIDWSVKLDDSVLSIGFRSKHTELLLPPYYDVPQVLDSIRYRLVREIGRFRPNDSSHHIMMFPKFWTQSDVDWSVKLDDSGSYDVRSEMEWLFYALDFTQNTPNDSSNHIMMFPKFWTQSDINWSVKLDDSVLSIGFRSKHTELLLPPYYDVPQVLDSIRYRLFYPFDFTQNTPNDSSNHIMMFPKFWTQSDIDWSVKLHDSGSYDVRSEMEWLSYRLDFAQNTPNYSSHHIMMFPKFWTQSDIDWSVKLDDSGSYEVRSKMFYPLDFTQNRPNDSSHHIMMFPKFWTQSDIDWSVKLDDSGSYEVRSEMEWLFYPLDFTQNRPNDSSHHIMMFPKFWTQSDIDWSVKFHDSGSYDVRYEMEWLVYCIVLSVGFRSKHTELLLPPYYDVPQVLDSTRYRLVREIGQFRFVRSSL
ncbi:unnamed protein product [Prunus armeniaca]